MKFKIQECVGALAKVVVFGLAIWIAGMALVGLLDVQSQSRVFRSLINTIPWAGYAHIVGGSLALIFGGIQLSSQLRRRNLKLHMLIGKLYVICVLTSSVGAMVNLPSSTSVWTAKMGFWLLAIIWPLTTLAGYPRGGQFDFKWHGQLMIYSYSLTCAAISLRLLVGVLMSAGFDFSIAYPIAAWGGTLINLFIAFVALQIVGRYRLAKLESAA